jgi:parallel beta-helix repeat protein
MKNRVIGEIGILLIISIVLVAALEVQLANALGTISILSDGSVSPSNSPIQRNGNLYTLTSNISCSSDGIHIGKDNIVIDGAGHFLQGSGGSGLLLVGRNNVTIRNMGIVGFYQGIMLTWDDITIFGSTKCSIIGNSVENNNYGIFLYRSSNNKIAGNTIAANTQSAILLVDGSNGNLVLQNNVTNNAAGILDDSEKPMSGCGSNNITANIITGNGDAISFQGYGNSISYNDIVQNNGVGICFGSAAGSGSSSNTVFKNHIESNRGDSICFYGCSNNNVTSNDIISNGNGITFDAYWYYGDLIPSNNFVSGNNIVGSNGDGVRFVGSQNSTISQNNINNDRANGIYFDRYLSGESNTYIYCSNNTVYGNTLAQNLGYGIRQSEPLTDHGGYPETDNRYYHNNFVSNQAGPAYTPYWEASVDSWDNGYPSGGNYWNDFANFDIYSGPSQNLLGCDGIWDQMRMLDEGTWDHYPLVYPWSTGLILFSDGFESGGFNRWTGTGVSSGETVAVVNVPSHHGLYSGRFTSNGGGGFETAYCYETVASSTELYVRGYFQVSQSGITSNDQRFHMIVFMAGSTPLAYAGWRMTGGVVKWTVIIRDGTNSVWPTAYSTVTPSLNKWYCVELHWKNDAVNGLGELWVDGTQVCSISGKNTALQGNVSVVRFGLGDIYCGSTIVYGDCAKITSHYVGEEPVQSGLVVRGVDNRIYYRVWSGNGWEDWKVLPGATIDSPAAVLLGNELQVVVRGSDGYSLWHGYVNMTDNKFSGWTMLSGSTPSAPTLTSNGTVLCLVVRGGDNRIYYRCYGGSWGSWYAVPTGATPYGPAAAMIGDNLTIVVRGMDGASLWQTIIRTTDSTVLRSWTQISGSTLSRPVLTASASTNKLYLVVRGNDNAIYCRSYDALADSWGSWIALTGSTIDGPGAAVVDGWLHVVVRGSVGSTLWHGHVDLSSSIFSGWTLLTGSTPSAPTLAS